MQRWTPIAGCVGQAEGTHVTWADHCAEVEYQVDDMQKHACQMARERDEMMVERNNAEKREYELLGRANALDAELKATQARLDASDELLREAFAQRQDAITYLTPEQRQEYQAHLNAGMRKMLDAMTPNA